MEVILNGVPTFRDKRSRSHKRNSTLDRIKHNYETTIANTRLNVEINRLIEVKKNYNRLNPLVLYQ